MKWVFARMWGVVVAAAEYVVQGAWCWCVRGGVCVCVVVVVDSKDGREKSEWIVCVMCGGTCVVGVVVVGGVPLRSFL